MNVGLWSWLWFLLPQFEFVSCPSNSNDSTRTYDVLQQSLIIFDAGIIAQLFCVEPTKKRVIAFDGHVEAIFKFSPLCGGFEFFDAGIIAQLFCVEPTKKRVI